MSEKLVDINGDPLVEGMLYLQGVAGLRIYLGDSTVQWLVHNNSAFYSSLQFDTMHGTNSALTMMRPVCKITDLFYDFEKLVIKKILEEDKNNE